MNTSPRTPSDPITVLKATVRPSPLGQPTAHSVRVLDGEYPDLLAILTEALEDAATLWSPCRCYECEDSPQPCPECAGNEEKFRRYRALHEALTASVPR